jgi:hypothetical protein
MAGIADYESMKQKMEAEIAKLEEQRTAVGQRRDEIIREFNDIEREIDDRKKLVVGFGAFIQERRNGHVSRLDSPHGIQAAMGVTPAVRAVIYSANGSHVKPTRIRQLLTQSGFRDSSSLLPQIHASLRRLKKRREIEGGSRRGFKRTTGEQKGQKQ